MNSLKIMKVLFINNYPMDYCLQLWGSGGFPGQHLWGITHLHKYNIEFEILPFRKFGIVNKIVKRYGNHLDQQLRIILTKKDYDLVYSGSSDCTNLLYRLRNHGLFSKPIVTTLFRPLDKTYQDFVDGHDRILCLTNVIKEETEKQLNAPEGKLVVLHWGVDLPFYERGRQPKDTHEHILSAGKTVRDYDTLAKAFLDIDYPLLISCDRRSAPAIGNLPSHITVRDGFATSNLDLLNDYEKAFAVAIPIKIPTNTTYNCIGMTSLLEAMAMAKPVLMTKNRLFDIDIEKERIGIWIEPDDVEGWKRATRYLLSHPEEAIEMGRRARILCEEKYNMDIFSSELASVFKDLLSQNTACTRS